MTMHIDDDNDDKQYEGYCISGFVTPEWLFVENDDPVNEIESSKLYVKLLAKAFEEAFPGAEVDIEWKESNDDMKAIWFVGPNGDESDDFEVAIDRIMTEVADSYEWWVEPCVLTLTINPNNMLQFLDGIPVYSETRRLKFLEELEEALRFRFEEVHVERSYELGFYFDFTISNYPSHEAPPDHEDMESIIYDAMSGGDWEKIEVDDEEED